MSARFIAALFFCVVLAGNAVDARKFSFGGRKLAEALIDTSKLVALPTVALPNVALPQNVQVLSNSDSGNTQTGRKLSQLVNAEGVVLPNPCITTPDNVQVLSNSDSGNTNTGRKLSQSAVQVSGAVLSNLPCVGLPKNVQVLANSDSGNTDTTGSGR